MDARGRDRHTPRQRHAASPVGQGEVPPSAPGPVDPARLPTDASIVAAALRAAEDATRAVDRCWSHLRAVLEAGDGADEAQAELTAALAHLGFAWAVFHGAVADEAATRRAASSDP